MDQVARFVGIGKAWQILTNLLQEMGTEQAWVWVAARTPLWAREASGIVSTLEEWNYDTSELNVEVNEITESISRVVSSEFGNAGSTAKAMRRSISEFRKSANLKDANLRWPSHRATFPRRRLARLQQAYQRLPAFPGSRPAGRLEGSPGIRLRS